jgi:hypothetical protein
MSRYATLSVDKNDKKQQLFDGDKRILVLLKVVNYDGILICIILTE